MSTDNLNANNVDNYTRDDQSLEQENCFTNDTITNLTKGVLELYESHMKKVQSQLHEVTTKQKVLIEQLHNENLKLAWSQNSADYQDMFKTIQIYRDKLVNIKKDMRTLHDKSTKLKKRALRLQQLKEKDEAVKQQRRQREQDLIAK